MANSRFFPSAFLIILVAFSTDQAYSQPRSPWTASRLKGTPTRPSDYRISRVFVRHSFDHPTSMQATPSNGEMLITQMNGSILTISSSDDSADKHRVGELAQLAGGDVNLFSAALHPRLCEERLPVCLSGTSGRWTSYAGFTVLHDQKCRWTGRAERRQRTGYHQMAIGRAQRRLSSLWTRRTVVYIHG